jgi:hypothetical protein
MFIFKDPKIKRSLFPKQQYLTKKESPYIQANTTILVPHTYYADLERTNNTRKEYYEATNVVVYGRRI